MKKTNILITSLVILTCTILSGCFSPVFYDIRKDVKPEPTTVKSYVNQITRYREAGTEYLVVASDKGLRYKPAASGTHDEWKEYSVPFAYFHYDFDSAVYEGEQIIGVFADTDTLYVLSTTYGINEQTGIAYPSRITLRGKNSGSWHTICSGDTYFPIYTYDSYYYSAFSMFQTNTLDPAKREVYIRSGDTGAKVSDYTTPKLYKVSGTSVGSDMMGSVTPVDGSKNLRSAVSVGGTTYFFGAYAATTNETAAATATIYYYSSGDTVYAKNPGNTSADSSCKVSGKPISSLAYCNGTMLIGCADYSNSNSNTNGGIHKTTIDPATGKLGSSTTDFSTNAAFQIPTTYYVTVLLNATPDKTELESYLYCGTQLFGSSSDGSFNNVGLWSWYPSRGNWNRE